MTKATVGGLIVRVEGDIEKILLTKRAIEPFKDYWSLPGGHIEKQEKAVEAVIREVKEETNLTFEPKFFMYNDEIFKKPDFHAVVLVFFGSATGKIRIQEEEVSDCKWFTTSEALKLNLAFNHKEIILSYALRNRTPSEQERDGIIEEFKALRQEMNTVFSTRIWGVATYLILVAGIMASIHKVSLPIGLLLLIYTSIPFILHTATRERTRIRIGSYIREVLEKQYQGLKWETCLRRWRRTFFKEGKLKGIVTTLLHVISLSGINLMIPIVAFIGLLFPEAILENSTSNYLDIYILLGGFGLIFCLLSYVYFMRIYSRTKSYDAEFAQIRIETEIGKIAEKNTSCIEC